MSRSRGNQTSPRRTRLAAGALVLPLTLIAAGAGTASASPTAGPTAIVSLGDSYISGEAGRWKGNSLTNSGSRDGTDRAYTGSGYDPSRVYGPTAANGCHRSDSAEVKSATGTTEALINLSCSGATTKNIFRAGNGGVAYKGEAPQADQLASVAAANNVKVIVVSIGGNDLGFADIITKCATDYLIWYSYCHDDQQVAVDSKMDAAMAGVAKSIDEIRAVMTGAGYAAGDYRIVLQSYPSPIPRAAENRYSESGWSRANTGGCPFWNKDSDWARDSLVPQIANRLKGVATAKGVQFLDLRDMLQGREVCAKSSRLVSATAPTSSTTSEWARWIDSQSTQGPVQESMHPNHYGQLGLGRCLTLMYAKTTGNHTCRNTPATGASGMYLTATS
ncbi:GDSL-like Lipase/Acylhydrolase family protein [Actinokineospora alba]|uniref:GDSL-like Lipase/Acylhydrolase family protein n=1 Tax=Actinokineospora alba TaxID=504798 RepID=A0A1H0LZE0_9PSEU|nr:GDSL-type esterase/lipase family protein [Actinokineospora alba]TDP67520.1 GDSL-like lipase/acylhydrolase family protein [Actinokineospora alba]SDI46536.1 GDSL-like Lipase/Acylhydrolase family protein [Actinokineospora alba]SDO73507.1 GDSL-like Lipase/Acylhydrolase family protein [Actinokineospora alba]